MLICILQGFTEGFVTQKTTSGFAHIPNADSFNDTIHYHKQNVDDREHCFKLFGNLLFAISALVIHLISF